jgi:hypothetical protein
VILLETYDSDDDDYNHKTEEWFGLVDPTDESVRTISPPQDLHGGRNDRQACPEDVSDISSGSEVVGWERSTNDSLVGRLRSRSLLQRSPGSV